MTPGPAVGWSISRRGVPVRLVVGRLPDELGGDDELHTLVDARAARQYLRARRLRTWGGYARACGLSWPEALEDWGERLRELNDGVLPPARSRFAFAEIAGATLMQGAGAYWLGRQISPDPREAGVVSLCRAVKGLSNLVEECGIQWDVGSPAGHLECLTGDLDGFKLLAAALAPHGRPRLGIRFDDAFVDRCLVL